MVYFLSIFISSIILLHSALNPAQAAESVQAYQDRMAVIEQQVEFCCSGKAQELDPVRNQIAERILAPEGLARGLLKEVSKSAEVANFVVEHPEQEVLIRQTAILEKKGDLAQKNLDLALKKLKRSISRRAPASVSDQLRNEVRDAYVQFQKTRDPTSSIEFKDDVSVVRNFKMNELRGLASISVRIQKAMAKVSEAYCHTKTNDDCKSLETLQAETSWYKAFSDHTAAANAVFGTGPGSASSGGLSAH